MLWDDLKLLLTLYIRSNKTDTYTEYFEGFKLIILWLDIKCEPHEFMKIPRVNDFMLNYEMQELAKILKQSQDAIYFAGREICGC